MGLIVIISDAMNEKPFHFKISHWFSIWKIDTSCWIIFEKMNASHIMVIWNFSELNRNVLNSVLNEIIQISYWLIGKFEIHGMKGNYRFRYSEEMVDSEHVAKSTTLNLSTSWWPNKYQKPLAFIQKSIPPKNDPFRAKSPNEYIMHNILEDDNHWKSAPAYPSAFERVRLIAGARRVLSGRVSMWHVPPPCFSPSRGAEMIYDTRFG